MRPELPPPLDLSLQCVPQYPHEMECLFAPLTGLEVQSTRIDGLVLVVEARLSVNLNALSDHRAGRIQAACTRQRDGGPGPRSGQARVEGHRL